MNIWNSFARGKLDSPFGAAMRDGWEEICDFKMKFRCGIYFTRINRFIESKEKFLKIFSAHASPWNTFNDFTERTRALARAIQCDWAHAISIDKSLVITIKNRIFMLSIIFAYLFSPFSILNITVRHEKLKIFCMWCETTSSSRRAIFQR